MRDMSIELGRVFQREPAGANTLRRENMAYWGTKYRVEGGVMRDNAGEIQGQLTGDTANW